MAWSPYKNRVIDYVSRNPGCCKMDVAKVVTRSRLRDPSKQYYIVNTALRNGWIHGQLRGGRYELYVQKVEALEIPEIPKNSRIRFTPEGGFTWESPST